MGIRGNIILLSNFHYISRPQYSQILPIFTDFKKYLIHFEKNNALENRIKLFDERTEEITISLKLNEYTHKNFFSRISHSRKSISAYKGYKSEIYTTLDKLSPIVIISTSDKSLGDRIAIRWAIRNNVPFIVLQSAFIDGKIGDYHAFGLLYKIKRFLFLTLFDLPIFPKNKIWGLESKNTYVLLWGEHFILDNNLKNLYLVGNPAFDPLFNNFKSERTIFNKILICSDYFEELWGENICDQLYKEYFDLIRSLPERQFIIKLHPREVGEKYKDRFSKLSNVTICSSHQIYDLFGSVDAQIAVNSATLMEAIAWGLPILTFTPEIIRSDIIDHFDGKVNIRVTNHLEMKQAIQNIYSNDFWSAYIQYRDNFIRTRFQIFDGTSTLKFQETVYDIIKRKKYDSL